MTINQLDRPWMTRTTWTGSSLKLQRSRLCSMIMVYGMPTKKTGWVKCLTKMIQYLLMKIWLLTVEANRTSLDSRRRRSVTWRKNLRRRSISTSLIRASSRRSGWAIPHSTARNLRYLLKLKKDLTREFHSWIRECPKLKSLKISADYVCYINFYSLFIRPNKLRFELIDPYWFIGVLIKPSPIRTIKLNWLFPVWMSKLCSTFFS